ncbi:MAG: GrpB family protein [Gammaproteobacteria bacterium]|nr:GrpB family protein [Gammaproteobacteria bacterium]
MRRDKLILLPYDPSWSDDFAAERTRIANAVADSSVIIEHVGSTSIPTVHAKPILDVAILCGEDGIEPVIQALSGLGYEYRGSYGDQIDHYYSVLDRGQVRFCQAHIYSEPTADWCCKIRFRDVLRENTELAREYNDSKLEFAGLAPNKSEYAEMKSKWLDTFIIKVADPEPNA